MMTDRVLNYLSLLGKARLSSMFGVREANCFGELFSAKLLSIAV